MKGHQAGERGATALQPVSVQLGITTRENTHTLTPTHIHDTPPHIPPIEDTINRGFVYYS